MTEALSAYDSCAEALLLEPQSTDTASEARTAPPPLPPSLERTAQRIPGDLEPSRPLDPAEGSGSGGGGGGGGGSVCLALGSEWLGLTISASAIAERRTVLRMRQLLAHASEAMDAGAFDRVVEMLVPLAFPGRAASRGGHPVDQGGWVGGGRASGRESRVVSSQQHSRVTMKMRALRGVAGPLVS